MTFTTITLLFLLILELECATDLTTNNCPTDFNITVANVTSGIGTGEIARFFYSTYTAETQKTKIETYIIESNDK